MGRIAVFSRRVFTETVREPLNLILGAALPLIMLCLFSLLDIPAEVYKIENLAPAIVIFGFSFLSMSTGITVSKDRSSAFLKRLYASPLLPREFIAGYCLPMIPVGLIQAGLFFGAALAMGMEVSFGRILLTFLLLIVPAGFYIACGMLFGTLFQDKGLGGPFTLFINLSTWLSGTWFSLEEIGGWFEKAASLLPFSHAVSLARSSLTGKLSDIPVHLLAVSAWTVLTAGAAAYAFKRRTQGR